MISFKLILAVIGALGIPTSFYVGWKQVETWIARKHERDQANDEIEKQKKEGQKWANRPRDATSFHSRLRKLADKK